MLILSTFTSDYLQKPLQFLLKHFTSESVTIKYSNKNLMGDLLNLNSTPEKSYAILFRICDFMEEGSIITENKLTEHLNLLVNQITSLKHEKGLPFLVFLCPSPSSFYINSRLNGIEKSFIERLNDNKIHTLTLSDIQDKYGVFEFENPIEDDTHIPYNPEFYTAMACLLARKLHAIIQKPYKLIAVDCDNTLWEGVAGDIGINRVEFKEHNIFLQNYLVDQQEKGIIICLCSKNDEQTVLEVFNQREAEMPLKLSHILKQKINWIEKSNNILALAKELNLNPDSFRFIDDNPWEINEVSQIPGLLCITMPQNLKDCKSHWVFDVDEHLIITETDKKRAKLYEQTEAKKVLATQFRDPIQYLRSSELGQSISINKINSVEEISTIERVSQLSQRTNQFNLFPEFKTINEINTVVNCDKKAVFVGVIQDNFTPKDAIDLAAAIIVSWDDKSLTIENTYLSCRGFNRGVEYEGLKKIACIAHEKGIHDIKIKFKKSEKNRPASNFLNILSDNTNTNPIARFILNKLQNYPWLQNHFKALFKKLNICLDFNSLELDEEFILILPMRKLMELEVDSLIRVSLNGFNGSTKEAQNKKIILNSNKISEKYLLEIKKITTSLDYLLNEFFIGNNTMKAISKGGNSINEMCINLLGEEAQDKSLVARGLDSLKATELRFYLYKIYGLSITVQKLLCQKTTVNSLIEYIEEIKISQKIVAKNDDFYNVNLPSSFQQQRIWFAEQQEQADNSANYHMIACYKVNKNLDILRFETACQELIKLYDVFGTSFFMQGNELKQIILAPEARELNFQVKNIKTMTCLEEAVQREIDTPWTMSSSTLIRFVIFKEQLENSYYILLHVHHAIFDAVSLKNCLDTLSKIYHSLASGLSSCIDQPHQYVEFICDQQKKIKDEVYQSKAFNFWKESLSKIKIVTTLPSDQSLSRFRPATQESAKRYAFSLSAEELTRLKNLARLGGVTCFSVVSALFSILLCSYTYQKNITMVTATNGRGGHASFDKMIGFFVNLLVQQFDLEENMYFLDYLKQANIKLLASQNYQDVSFDKIHEILSKKNVKDILLSPALIYQSYAIPELNIENEVAKLELPKQPIIFDMRKTCRFGYFTLFAQENLSELSFVVEYAEDLYSEKFIANIAKNFLYLIQNICENPYQMLHDISVVSNDEREQSRSLGKGPKLHCAKDDNLVNKFLTSVENYPDNCALSYGEIRLTYKEVDQQSTNLAQSLINAGIQQGNYVGIFLEPNHLFFIAELAILKIGAVFIPLSKEDPYVRLKSIIDDAEIKFFIVDDERKGLFDTDLHDCQLISIHSTHNHMFAGNLPLLKTTMEDSACILYTSGSTGKPKGVVLPQKAIFRVIASLSDRVKPQDSIAQTANQVFDAAQLEFLLAFLNGACLVIFDKNVLLNEKLFRKELSGRNIDIIWLTAGLFNLYALKCPEIFENIKYLMSGGDIVDKKAVEQVLDTNPKLQFMNGYGPTETGIFALTYLADRDNLDKFSTLPIGRPTIAGTQISILNVFNCLAPLGAIGQLGISGEGLGSYHNNELLQLKSFFSYPRNIINDSALYGEKLSNKTYLTGDKVLFKDNQILFIGRMNEEQIKIRGNLVALAEIKNALEKHSAIKQVEILYKEINAKNKALVVFFTKNEKSLKPNKKELTEFLSAKLPPAMIPVHYEKVKKFPLTANGKLDRSALSTISLTAYEESDSDKENISENLSKIQEKLLLIFKDILPFSSNLDSNFFDMGGNSIKAVQLISKIEEEFGKLISFNILRLNSSVRSLAHILERDECSKNDFLSLLHKGINVNLPPIVFIHPAGGGLFCFNKLINALNQENLPNYCYGIEDPVILERRVKTLTIPEMATSYLGYIQAKIKGPFILAGYSFGGMIALEIAAQLEALNQNTLGVILLDTWVVSCADEELKEVLREHVLKYCEEVIQNVSANPKVDKVENLIVTMMDQCKIYQNIGFEFKPKRLSSTSVILFKSMELDKFKGMEETQYNYLENFIKSKNISKHMVEGTHFTLLEEGVNLVLLAKKFAKYIAKISLQNSNVNRSSMPFFPTATEQDIDPINTTVVQKQAFSSRN